MSKELLYWKEQHEKASKLRDMARKAWEAGDIKLHKHFCMEALKIELQPRS